MAMRLTDEQLDWLAERVPDAPVSSKGGRPAMDKCLALQGIFWILDNGAKWKDLPHQFGSKSSVHKHFMMWTRAGVFERIMRDAGELVEERDGTASTSASSTRPSARHAAAATAWASPRPERA